MLDGKSGYGNRDLDEDHDVVDLFRVILENINDPVFLTDEKGDFRFICSNVLQILGYTVEEIMEIGNIRGLVGESIIDLDTLDQEEIKPDIEVVIPGKDGRKHEFLMNIKKVEISGGTLLFTFHEITMRKLFEKRYRAFIDRSPGIFYSYYMEKGAVFWSKRVKDLLGFEPEDLEKEPYLWRNSIHPDDIDRVDRAIKNGIENGSFIIDYRIKDVSGKWHVLEDMSIMIEKVEGSIQIDGIAFDITEKVEIIKELKEKSDRIESITSSFPGVIYRFIRASDGNMKVSYISQGAEKFFERTIEDLMKNPFPIEDIHEDDIGHFISTIERSSNDLSMWECDYRVNLPRSGKVKWIRGLSTPQKLDDGSLIWNGVVIDITETKLLEKEVEENRERLEKLIEDIPDGVFVHDLDGNMIMVNREAARSMGYSKDEMMEKKIWEFDPYIIDEDHPKNVWAKLTPFNAQTIETIHMRKDGTTFPVEVKLSLNWMKGSRVIIAISRDISERKEARNRIEEEMNRAEFYLDLLGHDIGNLHQGILTGLELHKISDSDSTRDFGIRSAESLTRKSLHLVKQVQVLSKLKDSEPELQELRIIDLIKDYPEKFRSLFPEKEIEINIEKPGKCPSILAEPVIEVLFFNLFHNAIKFQGQKAVIDLKAKIDGDHVEITISDHGSGIPDDLKEKVFERFEYNGHKGRVGLGLSLVKILSERYNGTIEIRDRVEGDPTKGASFVIRFPTAK